MITLKHDVTVAFAYSALTGDLITDDIGSHLEFSDPEEGPEELSVNLTDYGLLPQPGCVFIKDWSEYEGLTASLVGLGVVEIVDQHLVGPFSSLAYEVRILAPATQPAA